MSEQAVSNSMKSAKDLIESRKLDSTKFLVRNSLIALVPEEAQTSPFANSAIQFAQETQDKEELRYGYVVAVGPGKPFQTTLGYNSATEDVKVGDKVAFRHRGCTYMTLPDLPGIILIDEAWVFMVVEKAVFNVENAGLLPDHK